MEQHQERVVVEKAQLDEKLEKLKAFGLTATFDALPSDEKSRLTEQQGYMQSYSNVLGRRIAAFQ